MHEASSQEGKCLVYVVSRGNQDLDWWGVGGAVLQMPHTSEGKASCEMQLPPSEQLVPPGPVKPQELRLPPPTNLAPVGEAWPQDWVGALQAVYCNHTRWLETSQARPDWDWCRASGSSLWNP